MRPIILFAILTFSVKEIAYTQTQVSVDTIFVNDYQSFEKSIKSNRVIVITSDHIKLSDQDFVIDSIVNLEILGGLTEKTKITTENTGNTVITFEHSENIILNNLSIGHWPDVGYCQGNVLDILVCNSFSITNCDLFGSGVIGLFLRSSNVWCYNTVTRDCSEDVLDVRKSSLVYENCSFYLNENNEFDYPEPRFKTCKFYDSKGQLIIDNYNGFYPDEPISFKAETVTEYPAWSEMINDQAEFEFVCPNMVSIKASSSLDSTENISYNTENLSQIAIGIDEKNLAWVEGVKGNGIGEKIFLEITAVVGGPERLGIVNEFTIVNGYAKDKSTWKNNNRVKKFKIKRNNHTIAYLNLMDTPNVQRFDLGDAGYKNYFNIGEILEFEIVEVYKGNKYDDTAITYFSACCAP